MNKTNLSNFLLEWYRLHGRDLPWRVKGGAHPNPYVILVSEFMLQQTTVKTVIPYFTRFMERFPNIQTLAQATEEEVYAYWQGLGYYTRARSLHKTAQIIMNDFAGIFPTQKEDVLKLKGIGEYTVASFMSLAFNQPEPVIDGNVIRIICRMYGLLEPVEKIMPEIRKKALELQSLEHPADYASAIMDLGAMVCTPKKPQCLLCPWQNFCVSKGKENIEQIPNKSKIGKKEKSGFVYVIRNKKQEIFIRKRTEKGLLSGLYELPWCDEGKLFTDKKVTETEKSVTHIFTHIKLNLQIGILEDEHPNFDGFFVSVNKLSDYPFSTLMKKVFKKINLTL